MPTQPTSHTPFGDCPQSNTGPFGFPPGGPWFVFPQSGTIQRQSNPVLAIGLVTTGWVGYATQAGAECQAKINPSNPSNIGHTAASAAGAAAKGASDILGVSGLNLGSLLLRVGEVVLGIVLIGVGVAHMTGTDNFVSSALKKV